MNQLTLLVILALLTSNGCDGYVPMRFKHLSGATSESFKDSLIIFLIIIAILFVISTIRQIILCCLARHSTQHFAGDDDFQKNNNLVGYTTAEHYNTKYIPTSTHDEPKKDPIDDNSSQMMGYATAEQYNTKY